MAFRPCKCRCRGSSSSSSGSSSSSSDDWLRLSCRGYMWTFPQSWQFTLPAVASPGFCCPQLPGTYTVDFESFTQDINNTCVAKWTGHKRLSLDAACSELSTTRFELFFTFHTPDDPGSPDNTILLRDTFATGFATFQGSYTNYNTYPASQTVYTSAIRLGFNYSFGMTYCYDNGTYNPGPVWLLPL